MFHLLIAGETKEDKGATQKKNNLPKNIRLRATLMMNIRPSPGLHVSDFHIQFERIFVGKCGCCVANFKIY